MKSWKQCLKARLWIGETRVWHSKEVDHQEEVHRQAKEDHHQVKDKVHLQVIQLTEAHHQAKVALQVADLKAHQWEVLHNKALETYLEMHQIL